MDGGKHLELLGTDSLLWRSRFPLSGGASAGCYIQFCLSVNSWMYHFYFYIRFSRCTRVRWWQQLQMSSAQFGRHDRCVSFPISVCYLNLSLKMPERSCPRSSPSNLKVRGSAFVFMIALNNHFIESHVFKDGNILGLLCQCDILYQLSLAYKL